MAASVPPSKNQGINYDGDEKAYTAPDLKNAYYKPLYERSSTKSTFLTLGKYFVILTAILYIIWGFLPHTSTSNSNERSAPVEADAMEDMCIDFEGIAGREDEVLSYAFPDLPLQSNLIKLPNLLSDNCSEITTSERQDFQFNVTDSGTKPEWSFLDFTAEESRKVLPGSIVVERGSSSQISDIEVRIYIRSNRDSDIDNVEFQKHKAALHLYHHLKEDSECTEVKIIILLRPLPKLRLERFILRTQHFDIRLKPYLSWEINDLFIHSLHGNIVVSQDIYKDPLVSHNTHVHSFDGIVFGCFTPDRNIDIRTVHAPVFALLVPNLAPDAPRFKPENISIWSQTAELRVFAPRNIWPSQIYSHRTDIVTGGGMLIALLLHGSYTNLLSSGDLMSYLLPSSHPEPDVVNEIYTNSRYSNSWVYVLDPTEASQKGNLSALSNTISRHNVNWGYLLLRYPEQWAGELIATTEGGNLSIERSDWEILQDRPDRIKARRGENGQSQMHARAGGRWGVLDLKILHWD